MVTATKTVDLVMLVDDNDTDNFISKRIIEITEFAKTVEIKNSGKSALKRRMILFLQTPLIGQKRQLST
jgi:hypothetical protein